MTLETECGQKKRYFTRKGARRKAKLAHLGGGMHAYRCRHCGWWHVGHRQPKAMREAA